MTSHLKEMLVGDEAEGKRRLNVVTIVGGLADVKQERMLARKPEVGRWPPSPVMGVIDRVRLGNGRRANMMGLSYGYWC